MAENPSTGTVSGNRGLMIEEPLSFEQGMPGRSGVDLPDVPQHDQLLPVPRRDRDEAPVPEEAAQHLRLERLVGRGCRLRLPGGGLRGRGSC